MPNVLRLQSKAAQEFLRAHLRASGALQAHKFQRAFAAVAMVNSSSSTSPGAPLPATGSA